MKSSSTTRRNGAAPRAKANLPVETMATHWAGSVPQLSSGTYDDGLPLHQVQYLCCKLILRPNHFSSRQRLFEFTNVLQAPAAKHGVKIVTKGFRSVPLKLREVLFIDTPDFRLYNNAFILRRRIPYHDGFPVGDPEIVFKFRHPEMQLAAETDVRPQILGEHRVKFKCQALPLKEKLGGIRLLFSHNVQFQRSALGFGRDSLLDMDKLVETFPVLAQVKKEPGEKIHLVGNTIIEEVLQDICLLDFGEGVQAKTNVSLWRTRGEHRPLIGEFAFQIRFKERKELGQLAMQRAEAFFIDLQFAAAKFVALNVTKTGMVYRLLGSAPPSYE